MAIFEYKIELFENNEWNELKGWMRPFYDIETLDESLDNGKLMLSMSDRDTPIEPFTVIRFTVKELKESTETEEISKKFYRLVSDSTINQKTFAPNQKKFDHVIFTVELTKLLERDSCDTLTFTNPLGHEFEQLQITLMPVKDDKFDYIEITSRVDTIYYLNQVGTFQKVSEISRPLENSGITPRPDTCNLIITDSENKQIVNEVILNNLGTSFDNSYDAYFKKEGEYKVSYRLHYGGGSGSMGYNAYIKYDIKVVDWKAIPPKKCYTIAKVLERILLFGITRRDSVDAQKYILDTAIAESFKNVRAPEFHISRCTMFEALLQVGGFIHAIPRLEWSEEENRACVITFDSLENNEPYEMPLTAKLVSHQQTLRMDEYCNSLDSYVDNFINTVDGSGSVTEPLRTTRCEIGNVRINNNDAIIATQYPIYQITKLEIMDNMEYPKLHDITQYVYEQAEYDILSDYNDEKYPYSKRYALKYVQGQKNITMLSHKINTPTNWTSWIVKPVLSEIIEKLKAIPGNEYLTFGEASESYCSIAFKVEYKGISSARVKQYKPYDGMNEAGGTIQYNQGAGTVESSAYGENMRGAIARIGNKEVCKTYYFNDLSSLPKCGQVYENMYISKIEKEYERQFIKITLTLVPNFNRLSSFLGIQNNFRLYDVSEKQCVDRYINYSENCFITLKDNAKNSSWGYFGNFIYELYDLFCEGRCKKIKYALIQRYSVNGNCLDGNSGYILPCVVQAIGNSLSCTFELPDNFAFGYSSEVKEEDEKTERIQRIVSAGNIYGEIEKLKIKLISDSLVSGVDKPEDFGYYSLPKTEDINRINGAQTIFSSSQDNNYLINVSKDSRERIIFTYQLHFVTDNEKLIITPLFAKLFAQGTCNRYDVYFSTKQINGLTNAIDINDSNVYTKIYADASDMLITYGASQKLGFKGQQIYNNSNLYYKAWVIADRENGAILLACNDEIKPKFREKLMYISVVH